MLSDLSKLFIQSLLARHYFWALPRLRGMGTHQTVRNTVSIKVSHQPQHIQTVAKTIQLEEKIFFRSDTFTAVSPVDLLHKGSAWKMLGRNQA